MSNTFAHSHTEFSEITNSPFSLPRLYELGVAMTAGHPKANASNGGKLVGPSTDGKRVRYA